MISASFQRSPQVCCGRLHKNPYGQNMRTRLPTGSTLLLTKPIVLVSYKPINIIVLVGLIVTVRHFFHAGKPTVCPSDDSARRLSYQSFLTSIQWWQGHGRAAKRGEAGGPHITRNVKCLDRCSSRVRPPTCPCSRCLSGATPRARRKHT